jgi:glucose-1-phosphate adenylyltransferase
VPRVNTVVAVILGGGRGTRLYPLTQLRSKPAVPLAGKYRLVDIPISNCINSGLRNIFVLSQFQSASLNRHVSRTYHFDAFARGFVEILAAEQTEASMDWYQGTADAVRKQLHRFLRGGVEHILVLSGDQLYIMDFRRILEAHVASHADITVAATPVSERDASEFGILQVDSFETVSDFVEKPRDLSLLGRLALSEQLLVARGVERQRRYLASMGIYVFRPEILIRVLEDPSWVDFGKEVIPQAIHTHRVHSHFFSSYWEDIGTIRTFYAANLDLASSHPPIDLFSEAAPIYTRPRFLPGSRIERTQLKDSIVCEGCTIADAEVQHSVIGIRSIIGRGVRLSHTVMMGADFYEAPEHLHATSEAIPVGIGAGSVIQGAIIDKNARIGEGVTIANQGRTEHHDGPGYYIRDGIVIIPKNGAIPAGTVI